MGVLQDMGQQLESHSTSFLEKYPTVLFNPSREMEAIDIFYISLLFFLVFVVSLHFQNQEYILMFL